MKNHAKRVTVWAVSLALLITCALSGLVLPVTADSGVVTSFGWELSPNTGEKPSATPYILGGIMLLCVVAIVLLFLPKKKDKLQEPPADHEDDRK